MGNQIPKSSGLSSFGERNEREARRILVVNEAPSTDHTSELFQERLKQLPPIIKPLIPLGQSTLNGHYPALQPNILHELGLKLEQELRVNAEMIAKEQNKLCDKVRDADHCIGLATNSIVIERQRKLNKASENFAKFDDIDQVILRCEADIENILVSFAKLGEALPKSFQIEPFTLPTSDHS